ncbi:hypothetical protein D3C87_1920530 [compost metagenome]
MDDLGEPEDRVLVPVVEAVNEDKRMPALDVLAEPGTAFRNGPYLSDTGHREVGRRVRGQAFRPLNGTRFPLWRD